MPANAPAGSDSSEEREALRRKIRDAIGSAPVEDPENGSDNLAVALCSYFCDHLDRPEDDDEDDETGWGQWVVEREERALDLLTDAILAAGFTRAQHDAMMADKRRDTVECYVCFGNGATAFNNGHTAKCRACDGNGRLNVDAVRELVEDQYRAHKDTIAMVQAKATEALANNETIKAGYAALRAERDALAAAQNAAANDYRIQRARAQVAEAKLAEAEKERDEALANHQRVLANNERLHAERDALAAKLEAAIGNRITAERNAVDVGRERDAAIARAALAGNGNGNGTGEGATERDPNRCACCGWPLRERMQDGCVRGNCSHRPLPDRKYDPDRYEAELIGRVPLPAAPPSAGETTT